MYLLAAATYHRSSHSMLPRFTGYLETVTDNQQGSPPRLPSWIAKLGVSTKDEEDW
jgi:hypothetical protein